MRFQQIAILDRLLARRHFLVGGTAATIGLAVLLSGAGASADRALRELRYGIRSHAASGAVHVVEIDARSIGAIDKWPWPRSIHAAAIDRLNQAGARTIAFDVDFSSLSEPKEDAALAESLERAGGNVILPTFRQYAGSGNSHYIDSVPAKPFVDNAFLAAVNVVPDSDGYVRRMLLGVETTGTPRPSLASMVAESQAQIGQSFLIDFAIEPDSIPRHSMIDLINGKVPAASLAGKRIIIGATAVEMGDRYAVPRHGVIPGAVIQAMAAETLMEGRVPERWSGAWALLFALLLIAATLRTGRRGHRLIAFALGGVLVLALPLATETAFAISLGLAPALAAMLAAGLLGAAAFGAERYHRQGLLDSETGLPNLSALKAAAKGRSDIQVVVARIDRFAAIASGLGSAATVTMIERVAERLRFGNSGRTIYRTEEGSFAWVESEDDKADLVERIDGMVAVMRSPVECGRLVDISLSFGLAGGEEGSTQQLVANAALAALRASQKGVRWERYSEANSEEARWHLSLLGELDSAMASGHLWNAYQPKLDIATGEIVGTEALVRWHHPERGPIGPDSFIPIIEEHGRARDLTTHVLEQALEDAWQWECDGHGLGVSVNVSATLLADHEFIETVGQLIQASRVSADRVTIEVTETAAMASPERAIAALESWRAHGVQMSIDDYGTGQSSLGYLQKLPATELKIDKSFVQTIGSDARNAIMVRSTIALAHELGMKVVAEGIEDQVCLDLLADMGCDTAQGYHIGRPMPADALMEFVSGRDRRAA